MTMMRMMPVMTMMMTGAVGESDGEHSDRDLHFSRQGGGSSGDWSRQFCGVHECGEHESGFNVPRPHSQYCFRRASSEYLPTSARQERCVGPTWPCAGSSPGQPDAIDVQQAEHRRVSDRGNPGDPGVY